MKHSYLTKDDAETEKKDNNDRLMSLNEAAEYAGVSRQSLVKYVKQGLFYGRKCGGRWFFDKKTMFSKDGKIVD